MRKIVALFAVAVLVAALAGCGSGEGSEQDASSSSGDAQAQSGDEPRELDVEKLMEEYGDVEAFSEEGAMRYLEIAAGLSKESIEPDWEYVVDDASYRNYGTDPSDGYGHGVICFQKPEGEVTEEEYLTWARKVFDATAAASDDGYNVVGYEFVGEGQDALAAADFDAAMESWMPGWCYCKDGTYMTVYLEEAYDNELDSQIGRSLYYLGVSVDVGVGLQKSWDETMAEAEQYLEENEEEVKAALEEYLK